MTQNERGHRKHTTTGKTPARSSTLQAKSKLLKSIAGPYWSLGFEVPLELGVWDLELSLDLDHLTVSQSPLADQDYRLVCVYSADNLDVGAVVKAGLDRDFFGFGVHDREDRCTGSFRDQHLDGHQQRVCFALNADFDDSVHPGPKFQFGIWQLDFGQHGLGSLIQRVGEASDFAVECATWQPIDSHPDRLARGNKRRFQFGDGH